MNAMNKHIPTYESNAFAFHLMRIGSTLIRKRDGKSVYFQPGDCDAKARESVEHAFALPEAWSGENSAVFDRFAREYF
jgi:hypothetical protein